MEILLWFTRYYRLRHIDGEGGIFGLVLLLCIGVAVIVLKIYLKNQNKY